METLVEWVERCTRDIKRSVEHHLTEGKRPMHAPKPTAGLRGHRVHLFDYIHACAPVGPPCCGTVAAATSLGWSTTLGRHPRRLPAACPPGAESSHPARWSATQPTHGPWPRAGDADDDDDDGGRRARGGSPAPSLRPRFASASGPGCGSPPRARRPHVTTTTTTATTTTTTTTPPPEPRRPAPTRPSWLAEVTCIGGCKEPMMVLSGGFVAPLLPIDHRRQ